MGKKLLCLVLVFMMLFSFVLASCSPDSSEDGEVSGTSEDDLDADLSNRTPYTLTLWLPAGEGTTEDSVKQVEAAINDILNSQFTTAVQIRVFDEDEYEAAVYEKIESISQKLEDDRAESSRRKELEQSLRQEGLTMPETTAGTEAPVETYVNEYSQSLKRYPSVSEYQFDIFLITDYDTYVDLIDKNAIMSLEDKLNGSFKNLKQYIYPSFLDLARFYRGSVYAIPNNHGLGEYKFLLTNKELAKKYDYDPADLTGSIANCEHFIRSVARYEEDKSVVPLLSWVDPVGMSYWSEDGSWSPLASVISNDSTYNSQGTISNIFSMSDYKANFKLMKEFQEAGMIAEDPDNVEKFAVGVVSASSLAEVEAKYGEEYDISIYERPHATQEDLFAGAFAVSSSTKSLNRSLEVITAINTNPEIRNLLQYGVEGVHYNLNDDNQVVRILDENGKSTYNMNILYTGNTYLAYTEEGMDPHQWEYDKARNLDSILTPFSFVPGLRTASNASNFAELTKLGKEYYAKLNDLKLEDVDDMFKQFSSELTSNEKFSQMAGNSWEFGLNKVYTEYFQKNFAAEQGGEDTGESGGDTPTTQAPTTEAPTTEAPATEAPTE